MAVLPQMIAVEFLKLRRSLVLLLCVAAPMLVVSLSFLMILRWDKPRPWDQFTAGGAAVWAYFMLPMTVTALTILVAQIEHGPRAWNHVLALPVPRWGLFLAKAFAVLTLSAAMNLALAALLPIAGLAAEAALSGDRLTGAVPWGATASLLAQMYAGSLLLTAIQLWAALRFRAFVPPLVLGIGGTFVAVAATGAKEGAYFPWLIPTHALASDPARAGMAIQIGLWGGLVVLAIMVVQMSRAEMR